MMSWMKPGLAAAFAAAVVVTAALGSPAANSQTHGPYGGPPGQVVAESWWGHGKIAAPVRAGRNGWQVRLPRGTWIDCGRSCRNTLRQQTVDFWESNGTQAKDGGPGYFRWEFSY